jgi:alpha-mannosidase
MDLDYWFVPHTHWDREWYLSFQDFRWKLVRSVDAVLDTLLADPAFGHYMLDGQTVVLEDYLELRPARRRELADLARSGRIAVGPWYVQPDDILVSGESLVRNLERGKRLAREFGGAMPVGYLPDSFGHCAALPAILRGFGMDRASLMRGAGPELDKVFFGWSSRDGSRVLVAYLVDSYGNGADLVMEATPFIEGLATLVDRQAGMTIPGIPLLVMNGIDHRSISADLPRVIAEAGLGDRSRIGSLDDYISAAAGLAIDIPEWTGELRSAWRFPIIVGCTSTRQWIKREDQEISTLLEREAEPLAALAAFLGAAWPAEAIELAWKNLLQNHAHDSICGCSIDQVHEDMRYRFAQARGLAANIAADAARTLADRVDSSFAAAVATMVIALNPGPARKSALLSCPVAELPADPVLVDREGAAHPVQVLAEQGGSAVFFDERFTPGQLRFAMGMVKDGKLLEFTVRDARASWEGPSVLRIDLELAERGYSGFDWNAWAAATAPLLGTPGLAQVHAVGLRFGPKTVIFAADLPAFGAKAFRLAGANEAVRSAPAAAGRMRVSRRGLSNGRLSLEVLPDGSLEVADLSTGLRLRGVNRIVDDGDRGDEYNYDEVPGSRAVTSPVVGLPSPRRIRTDVLESGPVRATIRIRSTYRVPAAVRSDRGRRDRRTVDLEVTRFVSLEADGRRIEFRTEIDNRACDHRMRAHFPLPWQASESLAGGTFGAVRRPAKPPVAAAGLRRPSFPELGEERPTATHPFTGFVASASGASGGAAGNVAAILSRGLREYEVLERGDGSEIAVTLFRSVGWLSRADMATRRGNAGPDVPTPGAQLRGLQVSEYALVMHEGPPSEGALSRDWEEYRSAPRTVLHRPVRGEVGDGESLLDIADEDLVFSSFRCVEGGRFSVRAYDAGGRARIARLKFAGPIAWARKTRLDGAVISSLDVEEAGAGSSVDLPVSPWEIVTVEFGAAGFGGKA